MLTKISFCKEFKNLKELTLTVDDDAKLHPLEELTNLEKLTLDVRVDADLTPLKNLPNLKKLSIINMTIQVKSLGELFVIKNKLPQLEIIVNEHKVSKNELKNIVDQLPKNM